jgi:hypothetical protein
VAENFLGQQSALGGEAQGISSVRVCFNAAQPANVLPRAVSRMLQISSKCYPSVQAQPSATAAGQQVPLAAQTPHHVMQQTL